VHDRHVPIVSGIGVFLLAEKKSGRDAGILWTESARLDGYCSIVQLSCQCLSSQMGQS